MTVATNQEPQQTGVQDTPSPNDNYQQNPLLDENGNPKEDVQEIAPNKDEPSTTQQEPEPTSTTDWTDMDGLQRLEKLLTEANLKPSDVAKAIANNAGKMTPEVLKALEEKHGAGVAALIADQVVQVHQDSVRAVKERDEQAFKLLEEEFKDITTQSGAETFKELDLWAKTNVPVAERKELNGMLQQGGLAATLALRHLAAEFKSRSNITVPAQLLKGDSTSTETAFKPLSRAEYTAQLRELEKKGHVYGQSQEMARLDAQRQAGIKRGI